MWRIHGVQHVIIQSALTPWELTMIKRATYGANAWDGLGPDDDHASAASATTFVGQTWGHCPPVRMVCARAGDSPVEG